MKILAIDPGYERLGIAVLECSNGQKEQLLYSNCFKTSASIQFNERLCLIGDELRSMLRNFSPETLAIEKLYFNTNQKTAIGVVEVIGAIKYIAKSSGLKVFEYTPLQIKSAVSGNGRGSKKDVINMVHKLIKIDKKIKYDDEYDAIAVALTCSASERF